MIGIGDQHTEFFHDARFKALHIATARLSIPWDVLWNRSWARGLNTWLKAARAAGVEPLLSFDHSNRFGRKRGLPTLGQMRTAFRDIRHLYPWVHDFATWNEANYCGEPTCTRAATVATYYKMMRANCPSCKILAAELLDSPLPVTMSRWVHEFDHALGYAPSLWGLHDYVGVNRLSDASTRQALALTHGDVWITEVAGIVSRHNGSKVDFPQSTAHAATVTDYILHHITHLSSRIKRIYLYQWNALKGQTTWDSALIGPNGKPRPSFLDVLRYLAPGIKPPPGP